MTPGGLLLALATAAALLLSRLLDGLGVLPGVHEPGALRAELLAPGWTAVTAVAGLVLGAVAHRLRTKRLLALAVLVGGQLGLLVGLEELVRSWSGLPEGGGGESGLWLAVVLQVLVAWAAVTVVLVTTLGCRPRPRTTWVPEAGRVTAPSYRLEEERRPVGGVGGRAPPASASTPTLIHL